MKQVSSKELDEFIQKKFRLRKVGNYMAVSPSGGMRIASDADITTYLCESLELGTYNLLNKDWYCYRTVEPFLEYQDPDRTKAILECAKQILEEGK